MNKRNIKRNNPFKVSSTEKNRMSQCPRNRLECIIGYGNLQRKLEEMRRRIADCEMEAARMEIHIRIKKLSLNDHLEPDEELVRMEQNYRVYKSCIDDDKRQMEIMVAQALFYRGRHRRNLNVVRNINFELQNDPAEVNNNVRREAREDEDEGCDMTEG